jgi:hypothetical protein
MESNNLVLIFTGGEIVIGRIRAELEANGILCVVKNGFQQGIEAGFGGGIPSAIDLFVSESDFEKAKEIIEVILNN